jgi:hypothetical protein
MFENSGSISSKETVRNIAVLEETFGEARCCLTSSDVAELGARKANMVE